MPRKPDLEGFIHPGSRAEELVRSVDFDRLPRHVAVIMDGNGRWAGKRRLPRVMGHREGIKSVRDTVECAAHMGLDALTLYAFSVENWKRPPTEIRVLMGLLREYLRRELPTMMENDIRFRAIGRLDDLKAEVREDVARTTEETAGNKGLLFMIALSYGGRAEIVDAARSLLRDIRETDGDPERIDEEHFARHLYTAGVPDPDLLVRTSGELRISNFLLWQIAYAEIFVTKTLWPDFRREHLIEAVLAFQGRERRFGGIVSMPAGDEAEEA
jgi:undecaprenyl diphosphate synthase